MAATTARNSTKLKASVRRTIRRADARSAAQRAWTLWAAACADHVLACFEQKHPKDARPRAAIAAARAWAQGEIKCGQARAAAFAAHAAARLATDAGAIAAARAAGQAAGTAHMVGHAVHAAAYAVKAVVAVGKKSTAEQVWQQRRLPKFAKVKAQPATANRD